MSSIGQAAGGLVGAVVGFFIPGGFALSASIGMFLGGLIDPPKGPKTPNQTGPRLSDLSVQTATYGAFIPRIYGTCAVLGNIFWLENNKIKEVVTVKKVSGGGKGGGQKKAKVTTFSYFATFAVGLCEGPIIGVRRIWIGSKLLYNAGSSDAATIIANNKTSDLFTVYIGDDVQVADTRIQATIGVANTPAYRGLAYLVFRDLPLADHGNSLAGAQVKVEIIGAGSSIGLRLITDRLITTGTFWNAVLPADGIIRSATLHSSGAETQSVNIYNIYGDFLGSDIRTSAEVFPGFVGGGSSEIYSKPVGIVGGLPLRIQLMGSTIGTRILLPVGTQYADDPINGYDISSVLPAGDAIGGVAISPDGSHLLILTGAVNPTGGLADVIDKWYLVSFDGNASLISSGPTDQIYDRFTFGTGNATSDNIRCCALDSDLKTIWTATAFLSQSITRFTIGADGVMRKSGELFFAVGTGKPGCWAKDGIFYVVTQDRLTIATASPLASIDTVLLSSIVSAESLKSNLLTAADLNVTLLTSQVRGFRISALGTIRASIESLQAAFPFDAIQSGYKIKFVPRGTNPIATVTQDKLDARVLGDDPGVQITTSREMDSILPRRVFLDYLDPSREYDRGSRYAERQNVDAVNDQHMEVQIVLTDSEAEKTANMLLHLFWLERYEMEFSLPPEFFRFEPSDVVTLNTTTPVATYELRFTSIDYTSTGIMKCRARYNRAAVYVPAALGGGDGGLSPPGTIALGGPTQYVLLDIPVVTDAQDTPAFPVAMAGFIPGWPGGVLFQSADNWATETDVASMAAPGSVILTATNILGAHDGRLIDKAGRLTATILSGSLSSVSELQMLNGANHFAYGADTRWEIIAAQNTVLQTGGSYVLTDLLRGRFGTEFATGLHVVGDKIVELDDDTITFVASTTNAIGLQRDYRGISVGDDLDSDTSRAFTYRAVNLECLSPVYLNGSRHPSTGDWTLDWLRRTRVGGELRDRVDVTLGEASESYEADIFSDGTFTVIKRTIATTAPTLVYNSAQQVTDFGANQSTLHVRLFQMSGTMGRGYALQNSITR